MYCTNLRISSVYTWLIRVFSEQAYDAVPGFPNVDLSVRVLGFWFVWLFTVPSLRARKPGEAEKVALNIAFLATPVISFAMPFITKVRVCCISLVAVCRTMFSSVFCLVDSSCDMPCATNVGVPLAALMLGLDSSRTSIERSLIANRAQLALNPYRLDTYIRFM